MGMGMGMGMGMKHWEMEPPLCWTEDGFEKKRMTLICGGEGDELVLVGKLLMP